MRYVHTNIVSTDWQRLVAFYIATFDCKVVPPIRDQSGDWLDKGTGVSNAHLQGTHLLLPGHGEQGPTLEIYSYNDVIAQDPIAPNQRGFGHIAFEVDDVEATLQTILKNGGTSNGEIVKKVVNGVGEITFVYARDPDGNLIELQNWKIEG